MPARGLRQEPRLRRDRLLLAYVQHTAVHRKYGDFLECSRRYGRAMGVATLA